MILQDGRLKVYDPKLSSVFPRQFLRADKLKAFGMIFRVLVFKMWL